MYKDGRRCIITFGGKGKIHQEKCTKSSPFEMRTIPRNRNVDRILFIIFLRLTYKTAGASLNGSKRNSGEKVNK